MVFSEIAIPLGRNDVAGKLGFAPTCFLNGVSTVSTSTATLFSRSLPAQSLGRPQEAGCSVYGSFGEGNGKPWGGGACLRDCSCASIKQGSNHGNFSSGGRKEHVGREAVAMRVVRRSEDSWGDVDLAGPPGGRSRQPRGDKGVPVRDGSRWRSERGEDDARDGSESWQRWPSAMKLDSRNDESSGNGLGERKEGSGASRRNESRSGERASNDNRARSASCVRSSSRSEDAAGIDEGYRPSSDNVRRTERREDEEGVGVAGGIRRGELGRGYAGAEGGLRARRGRWADEVGNPEWPRPRVRESRESEGIDFEEAVSERDWEDSGLRDSNTGTPRVGFQPRTEEAQGRLSSSHVTFSRADVIGSSVRDRPRDQPFERDGIRQERSRGGVRMASAVGARERREAKAASAAAVFKLRTRGPGCYGCGAILQTQEEAAPGFVPPEVYELKKRHHQLPSLLCGRCKQLSQGAMVPAVSGNGGYGSGIGFVSAEELRDQLTVLRHQKALVVKLVDIVDFNGSFLTRVRDLIGSNPIVLVVTKVDLLPEGTNMAAVGDWLISAITRKRLNVVCVHLTSAKAGLGISSVAATIQRERLGRDVYVMGAANVGKSAFIAALLEEMAVHDFQAAAARRRKPVASAMPGTTLGPIAIQAFGGSANLFDTAGVHLHHRMPAVVEPIDLPLLAPRRRLRGFVATPPRTETGDEDPSLSPPTWEEPVCVMPAEVPVRPRQLGLANDDARHESDEEDGREKGPQGVESESKVNLRRGEQRGGGDWQQMDPGAARQGGGREWGELDSEDEEEAENGAVLKGRGGERGMQRGGAPVGSVFSKGLQGYSLFWGGLVRIDVLQAPPSVRLVFFGATAVRIHCRPTAQADAFYTEEVGRLLVPPSGAASLAGPDTSGWEGLPIHQQFLLHGRRGRRPTADVAISGLGWITVTGGSRNDAPSTSALSPSLAPSPSPSPSASPSSASYSSSSIWESRPQTPFSPPRLDQDEIDSVFDVRIVVHTPRGVEVFLRDPIPVGPAAEKWYSYEELSEEEEAKRPRLFVGNA
eukprot:TRINITY_DN7772_c0_g1_i1.p1 TRINITY_DN7772_c0_g1~~TRINITY_DN7772_c0_g1_i1.p1  ORF type:complete len:1044 (-),score=204.58 TRINITY_DN7772_c0_g1_i1:258-3389(-)